MPVPPLTRWGVSPDGDLVFRTLTRDGPAVPGELARSLGLPARRIRTALDELAGAGLARAGLRAWPPVPVPTRSIGCAAGTSSGPACAT